MQKEIVEYCVSDMDILTRACLKFRDAMLKESNICPFTEAITIASACNLVYRRNCLEPNTIGVLPRCGYRHPNNRSRIAIQWLINEEQERGIIIQHAARQSEVIIQGANFHVDRYCEKTRQIFEFHGCYYHGHDLCQLTKRDEPLHEAPDDTLNTRFERTNAKTTKLRDLGYEVIEMWECEFRRLMKTNQNLQYLERHPLMSYAPLIPRDAFYGGRTGAAKLCYKTSGEEEPHPLPCIVYVHGESYEWNSGNPYDGTVLASTGRVIVVTINFRLGVLGFLKTGATGSAQGNFGLMDLVAGLHWLRENLPAFGGDPERVTLMGHSTGAALVNFIAVSPVAKELLHRIILLSGSGLSPWALQRDPIFVKRKVAERTGCHGDLLKDDMAPCLRLIQLNQLLSVPVDPPRFLPGFAPFIDGTILVNPTAPPPATNSPTVATSAGYELADFPERDLLFTLTSTESYLDLSAQDLEFGFNETRRDRILRTYVRNSYYYHLNEIFSTLKNEYTDWERPVQNPLSVRDATLEVLSDGHTAAPLIRIGYLHALRGGKTFFLHFLHQSGERDFPQRTGSVRGEDVPYALGLPLVGGGPFFPHNYTRTDSIISKTIIQYISNFARGGDPNGGVTSGPTVDMKSSTRVHDEISTPFWDTYDTINQLYLELGNKAEIKNHYRGHKMSLWLNLIPQLHRPGDSDDVSMRHHHFQEEGDQFYDGSVRPQTMQKPTLVHVIVPPPPASTAKLPPETQQPTLLPPKSDTALQATTTECPPNTSVVAPSIRNTNSNNLLRKLASSHYQSYTTALTVTIAVGCFLLLLNILIFAGIYHQRDKGRSKKKKKKKEELADAGSCSSSSGEAYETKAAYEARQSSFDTFKNPCELSRRSSFECKTMSNYIGEYSCEKRSLSEMTELPLQEFQSSPTPIKRLDPPSYPPDVTATNNQDTQHTITSPCIPEPPPPPKNQPPVTLCNQTGILRSHSGPATPGTMKKRVQIQEISV